jgi:formylglycine-generating enzyme required for sulfatase activity
VPNRRRRGAGSDRRPVLIVALVAVAVLCWWTVPWLWRLTGWGSAVDPGAPGVGTVAPSHLVPNVLEGEGDDSTGLTVPVDDATDRTRSWATVEEAHEFVPGAGQQPVEDGARDWDDSLLVDIPEVGKPWRVPGLGLEMGPVQSGSFAMGSEDGDPDERPVRRVTLSTPLWMGRFEITNEQYSWFVRRSGYSASTDADSEYLKQLEPGEPGGRPFQPVCFVSWYDAAAFCDWLTQWERSSARLPTGYRFRLPTEAEWEYACRAGSEEPYPTPLEDYACFRDNAPGASLEVGRFRANAWGFHDMNGNVWEWCLDTYSADAYAKLPAQDPWNSAGGALRVVRGGSWTNVARGCRASNRYGVGPHYAFGALGFRIVLARDLSGTAADAEPATEP